MVLHKKQKGPATVIMEFTKNDAFQCAGSIVVALGMLGGLLGFLANAPPAVL